VSTPVCVLCVHWFYLCTPGMFLFLFFELCSQLIRMAPVPMNNLPLAVGAGVVAAASRRFGDAFRRADRYIDNVQRAANAYDVVVRGAGAASTAVAVYNEYASSPTRRTSPVSEAVTVYGGNDSEYASTPQRPRTRQRTYVSPAGRLRGRRRRYRAPYNFRRTQAFLPVHSFVRRRKWRKGSRRRLGGFAV